MFEKFTKKAFDKVKETAKEEMDVALNKNMPMILGAITIAVVVLSFMESTKKEKTTEASTITINNYYIG